MHTLWLHVTRLGLAELITLLLTAAIAWAGVAQAALAKRQAVTADRLLELQKAIEQQRNQVWVFPRVSGDTGPAGQLTLLEISNLSEVGIWIEKITLHLDVLPGSPNRAHARLIQKPLASMVTMPIMDFSQEIFLLVAAIGPGLRPVTFWAEVEFWAKGAWKTEPTIHYSADVNRTSVQNLRPC